MAAQAKRQAMSDTDRLAVLIRQLQGALGGLSIRSGSATLQFTASATANVTVTHGLTDTPTSVVATVDVSGTANHIHAEVFSVGATTFRIQGFATASITDTHTVYWIATG
jgi:hypothetical protein